MGDGVTPPPSIFHGSVVVLLALVHEALAVTVDLQEGLAAGVVLAYGAGECLCRRRKRATPHSRS